MKTALEHYYPLCTYPDMIAIKTVIDRVPNDSELWSCHAICRAISACNMVTVDWVVKDGWFKQRGFSHSWLEFKSDSVVMVLDLYPVASYATPLLVDTSSPSSPWFGMYIEDEVMFSGRRKIEFDTEAKRLLKAISKVIADVNKAS